MLVVPRTTEMFAAETDTSSLKPMLRVLGAEASAIEAPGAGLSVRMCGGPYT